MQQPFFKISPLKRLVSYIVPVTIAHTSSLQNSYLEFILYRNQWQLATEDALYSDGLRYLPFRTAFKHLAKENDLSALKSCLVLGTGLGSIVQILSKKYAAKPRFTLVENDNKILGWALDYLSKIGIKNLDPHHDDAGDFVNSCNEKYQMVCIDLFQGREVPDRFIDVDFLKQTKQLVMPGGFWIMNYIRMDSVTTDELMANVGVIFTQLVCLDKGMNRVLVAKV